LTTCVLAVAAVAALALIPAACSSGGVGDPCVPDEEQDATFSGFHIDESYIESRSFQCSTRVCLVNHFQGRTSCPLGQAAADIQTCSGPGDKSCASGKSCVVSSNYAIPCTPCDKSTDPMCALTGCTNNLTCDPDHQICACDTKNTPTLTVNEVTFTCTPFDSTCDPNGATPCAGVLTSYVCHTPGSCQSPDLSAAENQGRDCCLPGTDTPVGVPICGQCSGTSPRSAASTVYCSCRCDVADGDPPEPDFNFCTCPSGFTCTELRDDLDLGTNKQLTGKYCVMNGTDYESSQAATCTVNGALDTSCSGVQVTN
jgi:hypothetical protein